MLRRKSNIIVVGLVLNLFILNGCGVNGDPGHCYMSVDWEFYADDYKVSNYEDNNAGIPDWEDIEPGLYYDCYPGDYDYSYESEDKLYWYSYTGVYTLIQNPGFTGGFLHDGLDGADTYFDLYLSIYAKKGLVIGGDSGTEDYFERELKTAKWNIKVKGNRKKTLKQL